MPNETPLDSKPRFNDTTAWKVLNSGLVLWLLTTLAVGATGWIYQTVQDTRNIEAELGFRAERTAALAKTLALQYPAARDRTALYDSLLRQLERQATNTHAVELLLTEHLRVQNQLDTITASQARFWHGLQVGALKGTSGELDPPPNGIVTRALDDARSLDAVLVEARRLTQELEGFLVEAPPRLKELLRRQLAVERDLFLMHRSKLAAVAGVASATFRLYPIGSPGDSWLVADLHYLLRRWPPEADKDISRESEQVVRELKDMLYREHEVPPEIMAGEYVSAFDRFVGSAVEMADRRRTVVDQQFLATKLWPGDIDRCRTQVAADLDDARATLGELVGTSPPSATAVKVVLRTRFDEPASGDSLFPQFRARGIRSLVEDTTGLRQILHSRETKALIDRVERVDEYLADDGPSTSSELAAAVAKILDPSWQLPSVTTSAGSAALRSGACERVFEPQVLK